MAYNNLIARTGAQALIPEVVSYEILQGLQNESATLQMFRKINMSTNQTRLPVLSALPTAYFVNGDTGQKQTTEVDWANKYLNVEEIAAIIPIPENVLEDVVFDVWEQVTPLIQQAIARTLDSAVFFGVNKPASWPNAIITDASSAGNTVQRGANDAAHGGIIGDFSALFATIEADGYDVNGVIANTAYKGYLRQARATTGESLLNFGEASQNAVFGNEVAYPMRGLWPTGGGAVSAVAGDFDQGLLGLRRDITYKVLTESVIQDNTGAIIYNLSQQDMVALRVTFRAGFQVANTINYDQPTASARYPFAILHEA